MRPLRKLAISAYAAGAFFAAGACAHYPTYVVTPTPSGSFGGPTPTPTATAANAQWLLERRFYRDYGRREHLTVAGDETQPLVVSAVRELRVVAAALANQPALSAEVDRALEMRDVTPRPP